MEYSEGKLGRIFYLRFDNEEAIYDALSDFIKEKSIKAGIIHFIGALKNTECVSGPKKTEVPPEPHWHSLPEAHEVMGVATIAWTNTGPKIHVHTAFGKGKEAFVGCIRGQSDVFLVIEAIVFEIDGVTALRREDKKLGINKLMFEKE
ncbi:PPC domain-containing DNA-binding protein [Candidatus Omnitrophota bacterium]